MVFKECAVKFAFATTLAAGLDGIEKQIEPPPEFSGDAYAVGELPSGRARRHVGLSRRWLRLRSGSSR